MTDEEKKVLFLKNQQAVSRPSNGSTASPDTPKKKKKHKKSSGATGATNSNAQSTNAKSKSKSRNYSKTPHPSPSPTPREDPAEHSATAPAPGSQQSMPSKGEPPPLPLPHGPTPSAPIMIEKSGVETEQGFEPASTPTPDSGHFFGWLFGNHRTYSYLSASTRAAIDRAPVKRGRWKYIVVHNSGTREGNARVFDIYHRRVRHMVNGLAYHFVIGDGHGSGDGQIEIGHRWTAQLNGGHVASDYLNDIALGICLVGDFNRDQPTPAQMGALEELVTYLRDRVGKTQGHKAIVHAHKEINPRPTDCPGDRFPYNWLHARFGKAN
jgi:hypothetical protein